MVDFIQSDLVETISPRTKASAKWIKLPLILLLALTGALNGLSIAFIKCAVELNVVTLLTVTLFLIGGAASTAQMFVVNMAMKYYD